MMSCTMQHATVLTLIQIYSLMFKNQDLKLNLMEITNAVD